ncbi:MAG TPA: metallophosphoesterase [Solirubrobacteraceae bacterium]|nr:metallophosphoesterase [Solirubrobacteraceae bacterium]
MALPAPAEEFEPRAGEAARPFVADLSHDRAVLWAVGDSADGSRGARRLARSIPDARDLDAFLYLGDVYSNGSARDFVRHYEPLYGRLKEVTAPTPGNHEWGNRALGYLRYWSAARGVAAPAWYAFRAAGWLVVSLNSEAPCEPGSSQHDWLSEQLRASDEPCLAFWHRPRFSAGKHGDNTDVAPLWDAIRGRAALVLSAHDHNLQRFRPIEGTIQVVAGAGGRSRYELTRSWRRFLPWPRPRPLARAHRTFEDPRLAFGNDTEDGVVRLDLRPGRIDLAFVATDGRMLDEASVIG